MTLSDFAAVDLSLTLHLSMLDGLSAVLGRHPGEVFPLQRGWRWGL